MYASAYAYELAQPHTTPTIRDLEAFIGPSKQPYKRRALSYTRAAVPSLVGTHPSKPSIPSPLTSRFLRIRISHAAEAPTYEIYETPHLRVQGTWTGWALITLFPELSLGCGFYHCAKRSIDARTKFLIAFIWPRAFADRLTGYLPTSAILAHVAAAK
ncbi:hypothetical protein F4808DRAFT_425389, partial [Astrocystis sublimbata]